MVFIVGMVNEHCQKSNDGSAHCPHWYELWPCCWCEDDTEDMYCDLEIGDNDMVQVAGTVGRSDVYKVDPSTIVVDLQWNPRTDWGDLAGLAKSIGVNGVLMPIILRRAPDGSLVLVDGQRRLTAALMAIENGAELKTIPAFIRDKNLTAQEHLVSCLIANDGKPFTALEEAEVYRRFVAWGWTQGEIAARVGKSQTHIGQTLSLLTLEPEVTQAVKTGEITPTVAKDIARGQRNAAPEVQDGFQQAELEKQRNGVRSAGIRTNKAMKIVINEIDENFGTMSAFLISNNRYPFNTLTSDEEIIFNLGRLSALADKAGITNLSDLEDVLEGH